MGRVVHETAGRRRGRNTNEGETDGARGNRSHSGKENLEKARRMISGGK
jgi:hypothetical protein